MSINKISTFAKRHFDTRQVSLGTSNALKVLSRRCIVTCPACRAENEMQFSALSLSFICAEEDCGLELDVDLHTAEILLQEEEDLAFA